MTERDTQRDTQMIEIPESYEVNLGRIRSEVRPEEDTFQQRAVMKLFNLTEKIFGRDIDVRNMDDSVLKRVLLKSPTGSGKTVMSGGYIDLMNANYPEIAFFWISPKPSLVNQSLTSFVTNYGHVVEDYRGESQYRIEPNSVTGINWELLKNGIRDKNKQGIEGLYKSRILGGTERTFGLRELVDDYRQRYPEGQVVVLIDEAHMHAIEEGKGRGENTTNQILVEIGADMEIYITATPQKIGEYFREDHIVEITPEEVRETGLIKQKIVINGGLDTYTEENRRETGVTDLLEFFINEGLKKRDELSKYYKEYARVNGLPAIEPLMLVNVPDNNSAENREKIERAIAYLDQRGYNTKKRNLVNLTDSGDEKSDTSYTEELEKVCRRQNVKVVVFKQSIGMGWDCSRAGIITFIRDTQNQPFTTQVLGRILRMPYLKTFGEGFTDLNYGYVYADTIENRMLLQIQEEFEKNHKGLSYYAVDPEKLNGTLLNYLVKERLDVRESKIKYGNRLKESLGIQLDGIFRADLEGIEPIDWSEVLGDIHTPYEEKGLALLTGEVDGILELNDEVIKHKSTVIGEFSEDDLDRVLKREFRRLKLLRYYPRILEDILRVYTENNKSKEYGKRDLYNGRLEKVAEAIYEIEHKYLEDVEGKVVKASYELPKYLPDIRNKKVLMSEEDGTRLNNLGRVIYTSNNLEDKLKLHLESDEQVKVWHKNGDSGKDNFSLVYNNYDNDGKQSHFFPDFLVEYEDKVVIYETKGILKGGDNRGKVESLERYVEENPRVSMTTIDGVIEKPLEAYYVIEENNELYKYVGKAEDYLENISDSKLGKSFGGWERL